MDLADTAINNAITFEVKKDGLTQRQSGDWQLRLVIAGIDMDARLTKAEMGTRFQCVMVEIDDDESPVDHQAEQRAKWRELGPTKQAGMRCKEPIFWAFLSENALDGKFTITNEDMAAGVVREHCEVASRRDLDKPGNSNARQKWYALDNLYQAWRARENAG